MLVLGGAGEQEQLPRFGLQRRDPLGQLLRVGRRDGAGGDDRPGALLVDRQLGRIHQAPLVGDHRDPALRVVRDGDDPGGFLDDRLRRPAAPAAAARRRRRDQPAGPVGIDVEQRVQRDHALGVRCAGLGEVDHDARFLAAVEAHDAADPLLVDAAAGGRREVHADGCAGGVPSLGQEHGVHQHVDLAALVGGQRLGEDAGRRAAGDGGGPQPDRLHGRGHALGVVDAGRIDDARRVAEAALVEVGGGHVQGVEVERDGQLALVEVAADDLDGAQRGDRAHANAAKRRHHAAAHGLGQREVGHLGRKHVRDVLLQQLVGGGHADVDRLGQAPDRGRGLLAQRRVGLIADHHAVHVGLQLRGVLDEPGIGVDRERRRVGRAIADQHGLVQPRAVALLGEVARELVDQQPAVGEDQDAGGAGGIDEAGRGDGLARRGRVLEPVAAPGAGVVGGRIGLQLVDGRDVCDRHVEPGVVSVVVAVLVAVPVPVAVAVAFPLPSSSSSSSSSPSPRSRSAISAASCPASASTWWRRSAVPEASRGGWPESMRSRPRIREKSRRQAKLGSTSPRSISAMAASRAARRAVPGASAESAFSPSCKSGSPHHADTRRAAASRSAVIPKVMQLEPSG